MNSISVIDRKLLAIAGGTAPETIDDVIQRMESMDRSSTSAIPKSWQALFEVRHGENIDRIQFALAGMNAPSPRHLSLRLPALGPPAARGNFERMTC